MPSNNVFQYSKNRTRKRSAKKSIKTGKKMDSSSFWNPEFTVRMCECANYWWKLYSDRTRKKHFLRRLKTIGMASEKLYRNALNTVKSIRIIKKPKQYARLSTTNLRPVFHECRVYLKKSKKDYRQLVGTLFIKWSNGYQLWFSYSKL